MSSEIEKTLTELSVMIGRLDERTLGMQTDITNLKDGIEQTNSALNTFVESADNRYAGAWIIKGFWAMFAGVVSFSSYVASRNIKIV
jgi:hypothetical protein